MILKNAEAPVLGAVMHNLQPEAVRVSEVLTGIVCCSENTYTS
jgi:hypothetical protein